MASREQMMGTLPVENLISGLQNVMRLAVPARKEWEYLVHSGGSETAETIFSDIENAVKLAKQETFKKQLELEQLRIKNEQLTEEKLDLQCSVNIKCQEINSIKEEREKLQKELKGVQKELRKLNEENNGLKAKLESEEKKLPALAEQTILQTDDIQLQINDTEQTNTATTLKESAEKKIPVLAEQTIHQTDDIQLQMNDTEQANVATTLKESAEKKMPALAEQTIHQTDDIQLQTNDTEKANVATTLKFPVRRTRPLPTSAIPADRARTGLPAHHQTPPRASHRQNNQDQRSHIHPLAASDNRTSTVKSLRPKPPSPTPTHCPPNTQESEEKKLPALAEQTIIQSDGIQLQMNDTEQANVATTLKESEEKKLPELAEQTILQSDDIQLQTNDTEQANVAITLKESEEKKLHALAEQTNLQSDEIQLQMNDTEQANVATTHKEEVAILQPGKFNKLRNMFEMK